MPATTKRHAKTCECDECYIVRIAAFNKRVDQMNQPAYPASADVPMVPVRAHWRRHKNYLSKQPRMSAFVQQVIRDLHHVATEAAKLGLTPQQYIARQKKLNLSYLSNDRKVVAIAPRLRRKA